MRYTINGTEYSFHKNFQARNEYRESLNALAQKTFGGLSFEKWYRHGYWNEKCIPYGLFYEHKCISNIFVNTFNVNILGEQKFYIQLGTVMTDPEFRKRGLSKFLMRKIFEDWENNCDTMYLYANDSVVNYYPRFGFVEEHEYQYSMSISGTDGYVQKLDINNEMDRQLLFTKCQRSNPFSDVKMSNSPELVMFHCMMFQNGNIYYLPKYDTIVIAKQEGNILFCYDIFCKDGSNFFDILSVVANRAFSRVILGFTPKEMYCCQPSLLREANTHLFVLKSKENVFRTNKLMFPMLCRT